MLPRRTTPLIAVLVLVTQLVLASSAIYSAHALGPPSIRVYQNWDLDTAGGFEKVMMDASHYTPTFVLARSTTGVINITFTTSESTPVLLRMWYGGLHPYTGGWSPNANMSMLPDGITYTIEPYRSGNVTVAPNANTAVRLQISAAPDTEVRKYNLFLTIIAGGGLENFGYPTVLTIVEGTSQSTSTANPTTTTTTKTAYTNQTVITSTSTLTNTSSTTLSTAFTNKTTTITFTDPAIDTSLINWVPLIVVSAVAVVFFLFLRRTRHQ